MNMQNTFDFSTLNDSLNNTYPYTPENRNNFTVKWTGFFKPDVTGTWTFYINSDDCSYFMINSKIVASFPGSHGMESPRSGTKELVANNYYPIIIIFGEASGGDDMFFAFRVPSGSSASSTLTNGNGFYFSSNKNQQIQIPIYLPTNRQTPTTNKNFIYLIQLKCYINNNYFDFVKSIINIKNSITSTGRGTNNTINISSGSNTSYSIYWEGYFSPDVTGTWTFIINGNTRCELFIYNNSMCVSTNNNYETLTIYLTSGEYYPIKILYNYNGNNTSPCFSTIVYCNQPNSIAYNKYSENLFFTRNEIVSGLSCSFYNGFIEENTQPGSDENTLFDWFNNKTSIMNMSNIFDFSNLNTAVKDTYPYPYNIPENRNNFTVKWTGFFKPDVTGIWTFYINSDDCSYFMINSKIVVSFPGTHGMASPKSDTKELVANNYYPIIIIFGESGGGEDMYFAFRGPSGSSASSTLTNGNGFYFSNK
jgi:hypothetical protein